MAWVLESIDVFLQLNENVSQTKMNHPHYLNHRKRMENIPGRRFDPFRNAEAES
jgi:hypothetical protein